MTPFKAKNSFGIPFLRTGPRQLIAILNQIIAALDAVRVVQGGEVTSTGTIIRPAGTSITSRTNRAAELRGEIYDASDYDATPPVYRVGIRPVRVNYDTIPTLDGTSLEATPAPTKTVPSSGVLYFWLKCVGTFGTPDTYVATIETTTTSARPAGAQITGLGFVSFRPMGSAQLTPTLPSGFRVAINSVLKRDQHVESLGATNYWWSSD